jgi:ABC-type glutathione transport system ATPase component
MALSHMLLELRDLCVGFQTPAGAVSVVRDVSFAIAPGEVLGLVG